jgi:hypothetical protein
MSSAKRSNPSRVHPLAPALLALIAVAAFGVTYWVFCIGMDALVYSAAALGVFALPVVVIFGITGLVLGFRRLIRGSK